jgi:hypothetical protein
MGMLSVNALVINEGIGMLEISRGEVFSVIPDIQ